MKRPFQLVAEIQDKDAEIARLKAQHEEMLLKHAREQNVMLNNLAQACNELERCEATMHDAQAEIERLKAANTDLQRECLSRGTKIADLERLLIQAADALENVDPKWEGDMSQLIAELRKAAE